MADIQKIPADSSTGLSRFKFTTTLDGVDFILRFRWNTRIELWVMDIFDADENEINMSIPLMVNTNVIKKYKSNSMPQGTMILFDTSGTDEECGFDELGDRCVLLYEKAA